MAKMYHKLTTNGHKDLCLKLREMKETLKRHDEAMSEISLSEDTSENMEYLEMRRKRIGMIDEIDEMEEALDCSEVIGERTHSRALEGSRICLENHTICHIFQLVNPLEANSLAGKVSCESPLGTALYGRRVGETVDVATPGGKIRFKVVSIK